MRLLLDECVPARLRRALPIAVLVLDAVSNELPYLLPLVPALEEILTNLVEGSYVLVAADA